ncbi:MAG: VPDSG-CTERM sorting domain-containing protein [Verrucomicrobiaceae bacterium]|nr:MAG: VPDSG-CTERM sorting domain-containing protein [Verrucomicrobiaceae bacterium]
MITNKSLINWTVSAAAALGMLTSSHAVVVQYFGEDLGLGENTRLPAHPNADTARDGFLSNLVGVGTEDFEGFAAGSSGPFLSTFSGAATATLAGSGTVSSQPSGTNGVGRYPISGDQFYETGSSDFNITFSDPVAAFGFYAVDVGDFNGQVTLTLAGGGTTLLTVPNSTSVSGGGVLYFGYIDTENPFVSVSFGNTASGSDFFAFDDLTVGSVEQVQPTPVPDGSSTLALGGLSLLGLAGMRRFLSTGKKD